MSLHVNVMETDGGGGSSSSDNTSTVRQAEENEQYELLTPIHLNEVLNDISNHYSAGYQDFADAIIQMKSVINSSQDGNTWDTDIVKEAVTASGNEYVPDLVGKCLINQDEKDMVTFLEEESTDLFSGYMAFGDYALNLEAVIAMIENVLKETLSDEEYDSLMAKIAENEDINSIDAFLDNDEMSAVTSRLLAGTAAKIGLSMKGAGLEVWSAVKAGNWSIFSTSEQIRLIKESFMDFVKGSSATASSPLVAKSTIVGSLVGAAFFFGVSLVRDIANDNVTLENEIVNAARAGVAFGAGMAGTAVTSYLAGAGFAAAGPIGAGVAVAASIIGNFLIDGIYHIYKYSFNDIPRHYEDISVEDMKKQLIKEGYQVGAPTIEGSEDMSIYDIINNVIDKDVCADFTYYITETCGGFTVFDSNKREKYEMLLGWIHGLGYEDPYFAQQAIERMRETPLDEEEVAFLESYYNLFFEDRKLTQDEEILNIYYELLYSY